MFVRRCFLFVVVFLACAFVFAMPAVQAQSLDAPFAKLLADNFADTGKAIDDIAASGAPTAQAILEAMADRRLLVSPSTSSIFYRDAAGKTFSALNGEALATLPADVTIVRINNRLRGQIEAALGNLSVVAADPVKRYEAAQAAFKSRDLSKKLVIEQALAKEADTRIKKAFAEARAVLVLVDPASEENEKLNAISLIRARGDQDAVSSLRAVAPDLLPNVRQAALTAAGAIESRLAIWNIGQNLWYGLSLSSVLLLAAIGLAITFGVMGVINMAHGEMVMIGAYATFVVQEILRAHAPHLLNYSLVFAIPLAFLAAGAIGIAIERTILRFLYGRPQETLLATWGLSLILQQAVRTLFGPTNREVSAPAFMTGSFKIGELAITYNRLWIIVFSMLIFTGLLIALRYTSFGIKVRAVTQNRRMASSMGIATNWVDALTFGLGCGIAGLAGVALSQIDNVSPNLGQSYIIDSFLVVVFGGVGNLWGTLIGALSIGMANKILEPFAGAVLGKIVLIALIILFIQKRPRGLFALKGRAVES